jgi:hypothetical protein
MSSGSSATDVDGLEELPYLSALFLIRFDKKVGYVYNFGITIAPLTTR